MSLENTKELINEFYDYDEKFIRQSTAKKLAEKELKASKELLIEKQKYHEDAQKARAILQETAENVQKNLEFHISSIVTLALKAVFNDPYEFKAEFVKRRNKTECDLLFLRNGERFSPIESSGGGPLDVASISLRIALWSLKKTRATLFLDEPGKFVSADYQSKVSEMLKILSQKLKIQFIVVSHQLSMIESADKVFLIKKGRIQKERN